MSQVVLMIESWHVLSLEGKPIDGACFVCIVIVRQGHVESVIYGGKMMLLLRCSASLLVNGAIQ